MNADFQQVKHDFINNSLRLEVLCRIIGEQLQNNSALDNQQLNDLQKYLGEMQELVKIVQENHASN
jgi:hypothetical protein